jgi:hypothetical protein
MAQLDIVCPHCKQLNRSVRGPFGILLEHRHPHLCTLCGTNLRTGKRDAGGMVLGVMGWSSTYFLNAFVYAAICMMLCMGIVLGWQDFFILHPGASRSVWLAALIGGAVVGVVQAERARRKGNLLSRAKPPTGKR